MIVRNILVAVTLASLATTGFAAGEKKDKNKKKDKKPAAADCSKGTDEATCKPITGCKWTPDAADPTKGACAADPAAAPAKK